MLTETIVKNLNGGIISIGMDLPLSKGTVLLDALLRGTTDRKLLEELSVPSENMKLYQLLIDFFHEIKFTEQQYTILMFVQNEYDDIVKYNNMSNDINLSYYERERAHILMIRKEVGIYVSYKFLEGTDLKPLYKEFLTNFKEYEILLLDISNADTVTLPFLIEERKELAEGLIKKYGEFLTRYDLLSIRELEKKLA